MNVPKLRFPGFVGEWEERRLDSMIDKFIVPMRDKPTELNGEIPWCRIEDFEGKYLHNSKSGQGVNTNTVKHMNLKIFPIDTLLVSCSANLGICAIVKKELITNQTFIGLVPDSTKIEVEFLFYFMTLSAKKLNSLSSGTTISYLSREQFERFEIILPSLSEQQKIATFLSAVDNAIQLLTKKKTLLENYKKGIMQKIFSQEIRFKDEDGNDFADWEEKRLGEIGESFTGLTGKSSEDFGTGSPYITYKQIFDNSRIDTSKFSYVQVDIYEKQNQVKFGDFFFTTSSETPEEVGFASVLLDEVASAYLNSFCFGFRLNSFNQFLPHYGRFLFRSGHFREKVVILAQGSTRYNISKTEFMKLTIPVPSLPEQQKIADFLSGIDRTIEIVNSQIEKTKEYKKGLLQQMFV